MPYYIFEHIETGKTEEVFFHMNDEKKFSGPDGNEEGKWRRVFIAPLSAVDSRPDPFSQKSFIASTNKQRQTVGDLWERSAELSKQRADKEGKDPVKEKFYENYKQATGLTNQHQARENAQVKAKELVKNLGFKT